MNSTHLTVLDRLGGRGASQSALRAKALLKSNRVQPVANSPSSVTVTEALRLWRTRLQNVEHTHQPVEGLTELILGLEKLPLQRKVEQFGFIGDKAAATIFFERPEGRFIGSAIVDRA